MWKHFCSVEKTWLSVGSGQPCNWCDAKPQPIDQELKAAMQESVRMDPPPKEAP